MAEDVRQHTHSPFSSMIGERQRVAIHVSSHQAAGQQIRADVRLFDTCILATLVHCLRHSSGIRWSGRLVPVLNNWPS